MERQKVKNILLFCRNVDGEINYNAKLIREYEDAYYIGESGGSDINSGIKSKNKISKQAEAAALNVPDFARHDILALQDSNKKLAALKTAVMQGLNGLPFHQKIILYDFYIKRKQWVQITERVNYSATQCKNIRNRGLDNLAKYFAKNEVIKNFNYPSQKSVR